MRLRDLSLRQDPDLRQELASLARGCDFVLPSRFKKRLKAFQQVRARGCCVRSAPERSGRGAARAGGWGLHLRPGTAPLRAESRCVARKVCWDSRSEARCPQFLSGRFSRKDRGAWKTPAERTERAGEALAPAPQARRQPPRVVGAQRPPH